MLTAGASSSRFPVIIQGWDGKWLDEEVTQVRPQ